MPSFSFAQRINPVFPSLREAWRGVASKARRGEASGAFPHRASVVRVVGSGSPASGVRGCGKQHTKSNSMPHHNLLHPNFPITFLVIHLYKINPTGQLLRIKNIYLPRFFFIYYLSSLIQK